MKNSADLAIEVIGLDKAKDTKIAELIISNKDEIVKTLPLYAAEDLKKVNFFKSLITSINYLIWGDV